MVFSIQKLNKNRFLVNNSIVISNLEFKDEGIFYKIDYDEKIITEGEAKEIGEEFIDILYKLTLSKK